MAKGQQRRWALIVHGGAEPIEDEERAENKRGQLQALAAARAVLERGDSAIEGGEASTRVLEALLALTACGCTGWWHNSPSFRVGRCAEDAEPMIWTNKNEEASEHV